MATTVKLYIGAHGEFAEETADGRLRTFREMRGRRLVAMPADYVPPNIYRTLSVIRQNISADRWTYDGVEYALAT